MRALGLLALTLLAAGCAETDPTISVSRTLKVEKVGTGGGIIRSEPAAIECGERCTGTFANTTTLRLLALPDEASEFIGWSGDCDGKRGCVVYLDGDRSVVAEFRPRLTVIPPRKLVIATEGSGLGFVTSELPSPLYCEGSCARTYSDGTELTLQATSVGSRFVGWGGACSGSDPTCTLTLTSDVNVTAEFAEPLPGLTVTVKGWGRVQSTPAAIDCKSGSCRSDFLLDEQVTLVATADSGSKFSHWSDECSGAGECSVTIAGTHKVTANFVPCNGSCPWSWTTAAVGPDEGTVIAGDDSGVVWLGNFGNGSGVAEIDLGSGPLRSEHSDLFLARFSAEGALFWAKRLGGVGADTGMGLAIDALGNAYVSGTFSDSVDFGMGPVFSGSGTRDAFVAKYDVSGVLQWVNAFGSTGHDEARALALASNGDVVVAGSSSDLPFRIGNTDVKGRGFLARFGSDGTLKWAKGISTGSTPLTFNSLAIDSFGAILAGGTFVGPHTLGGGWLNASSTDVFLARYDGSGNFRWARQVSGENLEDGGELAIDGDDNVYLVGSSSSSSLTFDAVTHPRGFSGDEPWIASFSPEGALRWSRRYLTSTAGGAGFDGVKVSSFGEVVVSGAAQGTVTFGAESVIPKKVSLVVLRLDTLGSVTSLDEFPNAHQGRVGMTQQGNVLLTGTQEGVDFGVRPGLLPTSGDLDAFFAVLAP